MTDSELRTQLREWILHRAKDEPEEFEDDTPILERGILSSLDVVELVLYIERLRGAEVEIDSLEPESIRDVNAIVHTFFG